MYKIEWDKKTRGVKLSSLVTADTLGVSPRPVFYEELDLLKMDTEFGWQYPHCQEPLLWCINKVYYYEGEKVMEVHGANLYDPAVVTLADEKYRGIKLKKVNVKKMLEVCNDEMFLLESEAMEFIRSTYVQYSSAKKSVEAVKANQIDFDELLKRVEKQSKKKMAIVKQDCDSFDIMPLEDAKASGKRTYQTTKIDKFLASFSGGKDSQVVLDLCTRAIPPDAFEVIYSDTGYELPPSLELYEEVQKYYHDKFPGLKFSTAKNHESVLNYWDQIGAPSDDLRWCCAMMKTGPLYRTMKVEGTNRQARVLAFEGVRAEESSKRGEYDRIGKGVKHGTTINARPIFNWNSVEIFLYLFKHNLPINEAYRIGKARVGCIICPYSTAWDDMIANTIYKDNLHPFLKKLEDYAKRGGVKDWENYLKERKWKFRSSGNLIKNDSSVTFISVTPNLKAKVHNPHKNIEDWLFTIGPYTLLSKGEIKRGEIQYKQDIYQFSIEKVEGKNDYTVMLYNVLDAHLIKLFKRVLIKTTYCINCEVCEVECPTGALSVYPQIKIDRSKCIHCHRCLEFHDNGCYPASSLMTTNNTNNMKSKTGIDKYKTFGLQEEWLDLYFSDSEQMLDKESSSIGKLQVDGLKSWLRDAEIIDNKDNKTELYDIISDIYKNNPFLAWEIIWINITYNSFVANWFTSKIRTGFPYSKNLLVEMIKEEFPGVYGDRTISNAVGALINTLTKSPIGSEFLQAENTGNGTYIRNVYENLSEISLAYSIYKYAELHKTNILRVSEFYNFDNPAGPFMEFCIERNNFENLLRSLNSDSDKVLLAELNMGLDNITLMPDMTPIQVLKKLTGEK